MSGTIFIILLRIFAVLQCFIITCLPILSTVIWILLDCFHKKLELNQATPLVKGPKHLNVDVTQNSKNSQIKSSKVRPSKISTQADETGAEENEPKPRASSPKCGRTQSSQTVPILHFDNTTKHVESLPESSQ